MKRSALLLASVFAASSSLAVVAGCGDTAGAGGIPKIEVKPYKKEAGGSGLANVNGSDITSKEMDERVNRSTFQNASEVTAEKRKEFLEELISNEVLYQEAKAKGYADHPRVKMMMVSLLQRDALGNNAEAPTIPDAETKKYFDSHHEEYVIPEKVRARRILVQFGSDEGEAKKKAEEIRKRATAKPEDFGNLAMEVSEGPEKARKGELGYFAASGRDGLNQTIVTKAFALKNGEISSVFKTDEGWNIVKVENRAPRTERTYDQVKKSIERKLLTERRKQMLDNYIAELKNNAKVTVNDDALASYVPTIQPKPAFNPQMIQQMQSLGMGGGAGHPEMPGAPGASSVMVPSAAKAGGDGHDH